MNIGNAVFIFLLYQKNVFQYDILSDDTWLVRCTLNPTQYIIDLLCADIHVYSIAHQHTSLKLEKLLVMMAIFIT